MAVDDLCKVKIADFRYAISAFFCDIRIFVVKERKCYIVVLLLPDIKFDTTSIWLA